MRQELDGIMMSPEHPHRPSLKPILLKPILLQRASPAIQYDVIKFHSVQVVTNFEIKDYQNELEILRRLGEAALVDAMSHERYST